MYKIINTTDNRYMGLEIQEIGETIKLSNDFEIKVDINIKSGDMVVVGNYNYLIILKKIN